MSVTSTTNNDNNDQSVKCWESTDFPGDDDGINNQDLQSEFAPELKFTPPVTIKTEPEDDEHEHLQESYHHHDHDDDERIENFRKVSIISKSEKPSDSEDNSSEPDSHLAQIFDLEVNSDQSGDDDEDYQPRKKYRKTRRKLGAARSGRPRRKKRLCEMTPEEQENTRSLWRVQHERRRERRRQGQKTEIKSERNLSEDETPKTSNSKKVTSLTSSLKTGPPGQRRRKRVSEMTPEEVEYMRRQWKIQKERRREKERLLRDQSDGQVRGQRRKKSVSEMTPEELEKARERWRLEGRRKTRRKAEGGVVERSISRSQRLMSKSEPKSLSLTPEEIQERRQRRILQRLEKFARMTEDERRDFEFQKMVKNEQKKLKQRDAVANMTPQEKEERRAKMRQYYREVIMGNPDRRQRWLEQMRRYSKKKRDERRISKGLPPRSSYNNDKDKKVMKGQRSHHTKDENETEEQRQQRLREAKRQCDRRRRLRQKLEMKRLLDSGMLIEEVILQFETPAQRKRRLILARVNQAKRRLRQSLLKSGAPPEVIEAKVKQVALEYQPTDNFKPFRFRVQPPSSEISSDLKEICETSVTSTTSTSMEVPNSSFSISNSSMTSTSYFDDDDHFLSESSPPPLAPQHHYSFHGTQDNQPFPLYPPFPPPNAMFQTPVPLPEVPAPPPPVPPPTRKKCRKKNSQLNASRRPFHGPRGPLPRKPGDPEVDPRLNVVCDECGNSYKRGYLPDHKRFQHNPNYKNGICLVCSERFKNPKEFHRHFTNAHGHRHQLAMKSQSFKSTSKVDAEKPHMCEECGQAYRDTTNLRRHIYYMHGEGLNKKNYIRCEFCPKAFKMDTTYQQHLKLVHPDHSLAASLRLHVCGPCGPDGGPSSKFGTSEELQDHLRRHHPDQCHPCGFCSSVWFTRAGLLWHYSYCAKTPQSTRKELEKKALGQSDPPLLLRSVKILCEFCERPQIIHGMGRHYLEMHNVREDGGFPCYREGCSKFFKVREHWVAHLYDFHGEQWTEEFQDRIRKMSVKDRSKVEVLNKEGRLRAVPGNTPRKQRWAQESTRRKRERENQEEKKKGGNQRRSTRRGRTRSGRRGGGKGRGRPRKTEATIKSPSSTSTSSTTSGSECSENEQEAPAHGGKNEDDLHFDTIPEVDVDVMIKEEFEEPQNKEGDTD